MKISEFINSKQIALYINNLPPQTNIDEALFPSDKQLSMELELAKGAKQRPVALKMSTFDVAAKVRALKANVNVEKKEMPFFKEAVGIKEKDRRKLIEAKNSNNQNLIDFMLKQVFDNYANLVGGADVQATRMRAQVIQKGEINIVTDDGDIVVDYGIPLEHKEVLSGSAKWSDPSADIVGDIKRWQKKFTDSGSEKPTRMLLTEKTFSYITINEAITKDLKSRTLGEVIITDEDYISFLKKKLSLEIAFLNGVYVDEQEKKQNYYEDNLVTLIPKGTLGKTIYSITPEEYDKIYGSQTIDTEVIKTGIAITTMVKEDPVAVDTKVSQIVLPSFDSAEECFFATVG
ncbi:major capsid protein [Clostridium botulinum]|nr:major capsid protein [Clostridium botulinum]NFP30826.1 major capsid protein [Clostridium botulinum]